VAERSKAWTVHARSNTGNVGSSPTQGMNVFLRLFCVGVGCGFGRLIPRPRSPTHCLRIKKLMWNKAFWWSPMLRSESNRKERERLLIWSSKCVPFSKWPSSASSRQSIFHTSVLNISQMILTGLLHSFQYWYHHHFQDLCELYLNQLICVLYYYCY
jgi:hypothetical protein